MSKCLYEVLKPCKKEEEVKSEVAKFFKFKINADGRIGHYSESILWEFKLDKNFKNIRNISAVIAQTMYYARFLKYGKTNKPLPPYILVIDKNEAFIFETAKYKKYYSNASKYDWDRAASCPCPKLVDDIEKYSFTSQIYVYDLSNKEDENNFITAYKQRDIRQLKLIDIDKKSINEDNFLEVYTYWNKLFGSYVENGRKASEYFLSDIEYGKSAPFGNEIAFRLDNDTLMPKQLPMKDYNHFWEVYDKVQSKDIYALRQKSDRISEDYMRRFTGEFYTKIDIAQKGWEYLEKVIGKKEWWKTGEYRIWDMAAGTGNLEFNLPESALQYCYISTYLEDDANYCKKIFKGATCFQYDYLNDDVTFLNNQQQLEIVKPKMPSNLIEDLKNPNLKWVIFINPPWGTSNNVGKEIGKKSKDNISDTNIRKLMNNENLGESSREVFTQFLYRISKEFKGKQTYLGLFAKVKYMNAKNDNKIRDTFFKYTLKNGFLFSIKHFFTKGKENYPVAFAIWDLNKQKYLKEQKLLFDVYNMNIEKYATKQLYMEDDSIPITKWVERYKNETIMPPYQSAVTFAGYSHKDVRDRVTKDFLCSLSCNGNDFQHQNGTFILSAPYVSAGAFSVTPNNFEKAMILHAVRRLPDATWTNDRDMFFAPKIELSREFITDCIMWSAFADSNNTVSLKDIEYNGKIYQIRNNLYPYLLNEVKKWQCSNSDIQAQLSVANEDRFLADYISRQNLSKESLNLYNSGKDLYKYFYEQICNVYWKKFKIDNWDVGLWQIKQALKDVGLGQDKIDSSKEYHKLLGNKLLPQLYNYGFLNKDIEKFEETAE